MSETSAILETRADAGKGEAGEVRLWLDAITLAQKTEEQWRKKATKAVERYRDEEERTKRRFNILFANAQTILPAIYNSTPVPDIRRRFGDPDAVAKVAAQVLERASSYCMDAYDFDGSMRAACWDMEVPGRGLVRVRYEPTFGQGEQIVDEAVTCEYVDWRDFIRGPGRRWSEVPWVAFEHQLTREELAAQFGNVGKTMSLDFVQDHATKGDARDVAEVFKRGTVYEVWDKQAREVLFVAKSEPSRVLKRLSDPLGLKGFYPVPRPLYSVLETGSLVPLVPYELYRDQAEELDRVTARITALVDMVRWRGLRAAELPELTDVADARDGDFPPVTNWQQFAGTTGGGGLEKALWMMPIETLVAVIKELVVHREEIKRVIYEITGLSDILRGASEAQETATAQRIKSQWGSLRIEDRQAEVARFARDLLRIKCEIIAEKFQPETLALMTGIDLPTAEMKAQAQASMQPGQPPDERMAAVLESPTWDDVMRVLRSDALRAYRVDIETDSTVQADVARHQENAARFVEGLGSFIQSVGPAVETGQFPREVAADLIAAFSRSFKLGRQAEDAMEKLKSAPPPQQPDPMQAEQAKMQAEQQAAQAQMQADMQKAQMDAQLRQAEMTQKGEIEREKISASLQMKQMEIAAQSTLERERMAAEDRRHDADLQAGREKTTLDAQLRVADGERAAGIEREKIGSSERQSAQAAQAKAAPESKAAEQIKVLADGVKAIGEGVQEIGERVQAVEAAVSELAQDVAAPIEAVRGADGRIAQVRKGKRTMTVSRGADGKAVGLQ